MENKMNEITLTDNMIILGELDLSRNVAAVFLATKTPKTRETYKFDLQLIARMLGIDDVFRCNWSALRYSHTQAIRTMLMETISKRTGAPLSASYINRILSALRGVLKTAWRLGYVEVEDYFRAINLDRLPNERIITGRELSIDEISSLLRVCENDPSPAGIRDAAIITIAYSCGLRRNEISKLQLGDYDPDTKKLIVNGKGRRQRIAYLVNGSEYAMGDWLNIRGDDPGPLFIAIDKIGRLKHGQGLVGHSIYVIFRKRGDQAGIKEFSPHDFRRTFISSLLEAGADISTVSKLAGHRSVEVTAMYDRRGEKAKIRAAKLLFVPYRGHCNQKGG